jgi:tetratricopeptide (TPR) repeat protein
MKSVGFNDITDFKHIFYFGSPSGSPTGEWITIYLALLPFSIIILVGKLKKDDSKSVLLLIPVILILTISVISFSRGMYLAIASFALINSALFLLYKLSSLRKVILFNAVFLLSIGSLVVISPLCKPVLTTVLMFQTTSQIRSYEGRKSLWRSGVQMIKDYPLSGIGANNFPIKYAAYKDKNDDAPFVGRVFNFFLQLTIEKGFIGLCAYCSLLIVFFFFSHRKIKLSNDDWNQQAAVVLVMSAFAAVIVRDLSYSSIFSNKGVHLLLWFMIAHNAQIPGESIPLQTSYYKKIAAFFPIIVGLFIFLFIALILTRKEKAENLFISFIDQLNQCKFLEAQQNIEAAIRISSHNAYYWACRGLVAERILKHKFELDKFLANDMKFNEWETEQIKISIFSFRKALELNPLDDGFYHNLGWLYILNKDVQQAEICFRKAIQIDSKIAIYHISLGLLEEKEYKKDGALEEYCTAVQKLPILLDAPFFSDLRKRMPAESQQIIMNSIHFMEKELQLSNSPTIAAKLAKLYLFRGQDQKSILLLERVTKELPGLSRPWLYLGDIYQSCNKYSEMIQCYQKAVFLDRYDIIPLLRLVHFYIHHNDTSEAMRYYRQSIKASSFQFSDHAGRVTRMYYSNCRDERCVVKDDMIPSGLLTYCSPFFDLSSDNLQLIDLDTVGNKENDRTR